MTVQASALSLSPPSRAAERVLMTADAVGGVWHYAIQLASLLTRGARSRVMLALLGPPPSAAQLTEAAAVPGVTVRSRPFALEWMPGALDQDVDAAGDWLLTLAKQFSPDVVHLNGYCHADLDWQAPTVVVAHSCVCSWWDAVHGCRPPHDWDTYRGRVGRGLRAASAVVSPTRAMSDALSMFYGFSGARVIPHCGAAEQSNAREKEPIVFAAGRVWDPAKNLAVLDRAAAALPWPVYIAGETDGPEGTTSTLSHARALGHISAGAVADWMARASIYAFPARYEPFGLSILEAALSGCALVLGDIPSLRENWSGAARFVSTDNPNQLDVVLRELIDRPATREALGQAARARAALFSPARHARAYESLYVEMVTSHDRAAHSSRSH